MSETVRLIARLRERGLTQAEIVRRTGIPQPRLSRWSRGDVPVGADDVLRLAAIEREMVDAEVAPPVTAAAAGGEAAGAVHAG